MTVVQVQAASLYGPPALLSRHPIKSPSTRLFSMSSYDKQSPPDYIYSENSDSKKRQNATSGSKRASRAGTRSVTTLTAAQLERKRANDREAQRAIRQRTKDHIESLERRIEELTANQAITEKLIQRNKELENENALLRSRLGSTAASLGVESQAEHGPMGSGMDTGGLGLAMPSSGSSTLQGMGQQRTTGTGTPQRQTSATPTPSAVSQPDPWQQHGAAYNPTNPSPTSRSSHPEMAQQSGIWRTDSNESGRAPPVMQAGLPAGVNYGYVVDSSGRPVSYRAEPSISSYAQPSLASDYQQRINTISQDYKPDQSYQTRPTNQSPQDYSSGRSSSHLSEYQTGTQSTEYITRAPMPPSAYHGRDLGGQAQGMSNAVGAYCPMPNSQPYLATAPPTQQVPGTTYPVQQGVGAMHPQHTGSLRYYDSSVN